MIQKKLHPTKKLGAPLKTKKRKIEPTAALLHNLRKVAADNHFHYGRQDFRES
jgi:hypothetical protein